VFAENEAQCVNASMQFDCEKHEPTYQFVLGFPGNSFAIEIASRLGLNNDLIQRATELTGSQNVELTDLIKKMNDEKKKMAENNYQLEIKTRLHEMKSNELGEKINHLEKEKKKLLKSSLADTQEYLTAIQRRLNEEMSDLKKMHKEEKKQKIVSLNDDVQAALNTINEKKMSLKDKAPASQNIQLGDVVWVATFDAKAVIVDMRKDACKVDMNGIIYNVKKGDIYKLEEEKQEPVSFITNRNMDYTGKVNFEINLLGKTYDESLPLVQDLIDNALLCGLSKVRIVHGRGTGALRKKIRDYLKNNSKVQDFYSPAQEAGGDGVTVVVVS
jgi:DNA mismatch repair protein MutS2